MRRTRRAPSPPCSRPGEPTSSEVRVHTLEADGLPLRVLALPARPSTLPDVLTPAEGDVAARLIRGESRRSIAAARGVSAHTVDSQIRTLLEKLGAGSASELVARLGDAKA